MVRFADNTETIIGLDLSEKLNASWNVSCLDNSMRSFIFKLHTNSLSFNHLITHFVENIEPYCTFCMLTRHNAPERDTALHVFYTCPTTETLNGNYFSWLLETATVPMRSKVFGFFQALNEENNKILFLATKILQKYISDCKLRNTLPNIIEIRSIVLDQFFMMKKINIKLKDSLESCTINTLK